MLRSSRTALSALQKTYDESYLTCSTAVYYESQGNESEAMRCWRAALNQIHDRHATPALSSYTPKSDTEKALIDSIRELELQCKERIDLLEALRLSRQEEGCSGAHVGTSSPSSDTESREKGWIGDGTVPAITYPELSRPALPPRPSLPTRTSSEQAVVGDRCGSSADVARSSSLRSPPLLYPISTLDDKSSRSPSPERHTMRTTLRASKVGDKGSKSSSRRSNPKHAEGPGASKAATLAWGTTSQRDKAAIQTGSTSALSSRSSLEQPRRGSGPPLSHWDSHSRRLVSPRNDRVGSRADDRPATGIRHSDEYPFPQPSPFSISAASTALGSLSLKDPAERISSESDRIQRQRTLPPPIPPPGFHRETRPTGDFHEGDDGEPAGGSKSASDPSLRRKPVAQVGAGGTAGASRATPTRTGNGPSGRSSGARRGERSRRMSSSSGDEGAPDRRKGSPRRKGKSRQREPPPPVLADSRVPSSTDSTDLENEDGLASVWKKRKAAVLKNLPSGVDDHAAKQILNEIVVRGDEVHWSDVAGLEVAKNALREAVVYPFLRPDLFMGLREPARGMLLFGPPGTGKTMLARAVATESKSTFFSISASSLTSKYLGESEKLVRALFGLAKVLAPSIIFVDEIDSLLSQRSGSGEHEATRRIKTEFLIQWSDLQRAAAGRDLSDKDREKGDANRVLVLAATNLPWAIDEAARRRFVRRQYIPLPEAETRATQLRTLLGQQKHSLSDIDIEKLVALTDGFSGSDITALAKDAAMGPLRSLGEALLHMSMDEIRPIGFPDFMASLTTIRPSVSKAGLKEYEDWAREFGERGG